MDLNIYKQGRDAARRGLSPADNPFKTRKGFSAQSEDDWRRGWCDGITGQDFELNRNTNRSGYERGR